MERPERLKAIRTVLWVLIYSFALHFKSRFLELKSSVFTKRPKHFLIVAACTALGLIKKLLMKIQYTKLIKFEIHIAESSERFGSPEI